MILKGKIVHGKGLGRTVGMPTANLDVKGQKLPEPGVYASKIKIGEKEYGSVTNVGNRPTVDQEQTITVETYIFDFSGSIYGEEAVLEILQFLRPVQKFQDLNEVHEQVKKDIEEAKKYL